MSTRRSTREVSREAMKHPRPGLFETILYCLIVFAVGVLAALLLCIGIAGAQTATSLLPARSCHDAVCEEGHAFRYGIWSHNDKGLSCPGHHTHSGKE